ncbi:disease resistance-like protein DSC1 [Cajanus cajan]|uniref:disease resistance-like protein DSC1 n=1 Tax=Cajanus cajan TaxID=3821 RepID=UPI0010FAFD28|nr:disease resistance-like protein DSC1 [Cajanus cajan]
MSDNMAAEKLEVITVELEKEEFHETTTMVDALSKMSHLKLLKLKNVNFSGSLSYLSNELGYITWDKYPFEFLPQSFQSEKLVQLSLSESNIKQLWKDKKPLHNLRRLDLSYSESLTKLPDFGEFLNLEWLNLKGCIKLRQIDSSIGFPRKLIFMNLEDCISLIMIPHFAYVLDLETLNLKGCIKLRKIDPSIGLLKKLSFLNFKNCKSLASLPNSIFGLNSLEYLSLSGCSKLHIQLFGEQRDAEYLKKLCIGEAPIYSQSTSTYSRRVNKNLVSCLLSPSSTFLCMRYVELSFCNLVQIPNAIGNLPCLKRLNLSGNNFATLPNLKELSKLYYLNLQHCKQLKCLRELPSQTNLPSRTYQPPSLILELGELGFREGPWSTTEPTTDISQPGLYIFNCPELVEMESSINMSLSWMIQINNH